MQITPYIIANTLEDKNKIQKDLDKLKHYGESKRMKFNRDKYKCLLRYIKPSTLWGDTWLSNTTSEKDLGIVVDLKVNISQPTVSCNFKKGKSYFRLHKQKQSLQIP